MRKPPPSVLAIAALFVALGCFDLYRGAAPLFHGAARLAADDWLVLAIGLAALAGGAFLLDGRNWARWLLVAWMALHLGLSFGRPLQLLAHMVIFGLLASALFRGAAAAHFRRAPSARPT